MLIGKLCSTNSCQTLIYWILVSAVTFDRNMNAACTFDIQFNTTFYHTAKLQICNNKTLIQGRSYRLLTQAFKILLVINK